MTRTDTVVDRDTVTLTQRGDTILLESTKWRWRVRETRDTVYPSSIQFRLNVELKTELDKTKRN